MRIKILGSGSPEAMPILTCGCKFCRGSVIRLRPSVLVSDKGFNILLDISPDIRQQLIENKVNKISGILTTHPHFDHIWGVGDIAQLRWVNLMNFKTYMSKSTRDYLKANISWANLNTETFEYNKTFEVGKFKITPIKVEHVSYFETNGYIIEEAGKKLVYLPDIKSIAEEALELSKNSDVLIFDSQYVLGKYISDEDHLGGDELINLAKKFNAKKTYLLGYSEHWYKLNPREAEKKLPKNFYIAEDKQDIIL